MLGNKKVFIIAEAGVNHNGSIEIAKQLIDKASEAGADAVKFQTFKAENLVSRSAPKADYQQKTTGQSESQFEMIKKLELDIHAHHELKSYCDQKEILFLSTAFDLDSIDLLESFGIPFYKIPSGEITNLPYLRKIAATGKSVIISTGMADLGEIEDALEVLIKGELTLDMVTILHCNTEYPTPMKDVNLKAMQTIGAAFPGVQIGYSDHTLGIEIPIAAVAMGASLIEKHFTLDKNMEGPDHRASLEPNELKEMVSAIRNIEMALGNGIKKPSPSEQKNKSMARKSLVAIRSIKKGEIFSSKNIGVKRPGSGINPMRWNEILGQVAQKDYQEDELL
jgi:N,N'-diacetyllegionaminate synthase